ncbi:MAG: hypothetical protein VXW65_00540 [Pseudomonadota bacterium]|nr:hypothetical protein [Pseudomonadota bacterium]
MEKTRMLMLRDALNEFSAHSNQHPSAALLYPIEANDIRGLRDCTGEVLGAYRLAKGRDVVYIGLACWDQSEDYRIGLFFQKKQQFPSMVLSKHNGQYFEFSYAPRKQDGLNPQRKQQFEQALGQQTVQLIIPYDELSVFKFAKSVTTLATTIRQLNALKPETAATTGSLKE